VLALVVVGAASPDRTVPDLRLEGRRGPEFERIHRLDVDVTVDEDRRE